MKKQHGLTCILLSIILQNHLKSPTRSGEEAINLTPTADLVAFGFGILVITPTDLDANTIPDIFQFDKAGTITYSGLIQSDYPSVTKYITRGTLSKAANDYLVTISGTATDPNGGVQTYPGKLRMGYYTGSATYTRAVQGGTDQMDVTLTGTLGDTVPVTYTASTTFVVVGPNQISLPQLTARRQDGVSIQVYPMVLNRHGNTYIGDFDISDGNLSTSWRDYQTWVMELTDTNDSDGNGIPDLSDAVAVKVPSAILTQPLSQTVLPGATVILSVSASGQPNPTYQWQRNGINVPGAIGLALVITNVAPNAAGQYRVIVSNSAGTVISAEATIMLGAVGVAGTAAAIRATSRSLTQDPITRSVAGIGDVTTFFTTFDGTSGLPLFDTNSASFSGELRPRAGQSGTYEGDYLNFNPPARIVAYGFGILVITPTDLDANTIPDIFQFEKGGTITYSGLIQSDWPSVTKYITGGTLSKAANDYLMTISGTATDPNGGVQTYPGKLRMGYYTGSASYTRAVQGGTDQMDVTLTGTVGDTVPVTYTASTSFVVTGPNQISLPQLTARRQDGVSILVYPMVLNRHGNTYIGDFEISDGNLSTSWRDYQTWVMELTDTNDCDGNGIPDLSDAVAVKVPPAILTQPLSQTVLPGATVMLSVSICPLNPRYQWQRNGINVPGATGPALVITNADANAAGEYRVIVHNSAGTLLSEEATILVSGGGEVRVTSIIVQTNTVTIAWTEGTPPYLLQEKAQLSDSAWLNLLTTSNQMAWVPKVGRGGFFRVADKAQTTVTLLAVMLDGRNYHVQAFSLGSGFGFLALEGNSVIYRIEYQNLSSAANAAHIHGVANSFASAGVLQGLVQPTGISGELRGSVTLSDAHKTALLDGLTYVNINTALKPEGEIHGQVGFFRPAGPQAKKIACIAILKQMYAAVEQWALENRKTSTNTYTLANITDRMPGFFIPACSSGGTYSPGATVANKPTCTIVGHTF